MMDFELLRNEFTPETLACIAAQLQPNHGGQNERRQVEYFRDKLIALLGGDAAYDRICNEVGL
jgi:hypothetical protein